MIDAFDVILVLVGCFYAFAGFVAVRAGLTSHFLDLALARISMEPVSAPDLWQTRWLIMAAILVHIGGVALLVRADVAVALFALSLVLQLAYVGIVAPRYFDRDLPADDRGRRQTINAMVVYAVVTALVVWAYSENRLFAWHELSWFSLAVAAVLLATFAAYVLRALYMPVRAMPDDDIDNDTEND